MMIIAFFGKNLWGPLGGLWRDLQGIFGGPSVKSYWVSKSQNSANLKWNTLQKDGAIRYVRVHKMKYRLMKVECICGLAERTNIVDAIARKY